MKTTLAGYPYKENIKLNHYLESFLFCINNLKSNIHIPVDHLNGIYGLNKDECYQIIAKAEFYLRTCQTEDDNVICNYKSL